MLIGPTSTGRQEVVAEYFVKCWLCSKGFPSPAVLREHLQNVHQESAAAVAAAMAALQPQAPNSGTNNAALLAIPPTNTAPSSSTPSSSSALTTTSTTAAGTTHHRSVSVGGKQHACLQCSATFSERDELERHELTHSPTAQVVREKEKKKNKDGTKIFFTSLERLNRMTHRRL